MANSSYAPARNEDIELDRPEASGIRRKAVLRHSRMPAAHATIKAHGLAPRDRHSVTDENDVPSEDELFALWTTRLI